MTDIPNRAIIKLDHRNYQGCPTMQDSNQSAQLQRLSRMLKFCVYQVFNYTFQRVNNKEADQTAQMCRLVCTFIVGMLLHQVFSGHNVHISVTALFTPSLGLHD